MLFCGINPGLWSAATGHHFARPGNRFYPALYVAGFTDVTLEPSEDRRLPEFGLGLTNLVARPSAQAGELSRAELRTGATSVREHVERLRPRALAVLGMGAYRIAFGAPRASLGCQDVSIGPTSVWVLPNPSGAQARYQLPQLAELFGELRVALNLADRRGSRPSGRTS